MGRILIIIGFAAGMSAAVAAPPSGEQDGDIRVLASAGVSADQAALCDLISRSAPMPDDETRIAELIKNLSASDFDRRNHATKQLAAFGRRAMPSLRVAQSSSDSEVVQRATDCIRQIERESRTSVLVAAARVLGRSSFDAAPAALLAGIDGADEETTLEISHALTKLARHGAPTPVALVTAITDSHLMRRAVAGEAIIRSRQPRCVEIVRPLLRDSSAFVRYRVGVAMTEIGEREGITTVIESLQDLPIDQLFEADDFLAQIAGTSTPVREPSDAPAERRAYFDAWQAWWQPRSTTFDVPAIQSLRRPDIALACINNNSANEGAVIELDCPSDADIRVLRRIEKLVYPVSVDLASRGRVLICEFRGNRVTERDFTGKVYWERKVAMPVSAHRVAGGGCFIACRNELMCINRDGTERFRFRKDNTTAARLLPNHTIIVSGLFGICQTLDESGNVLWSFPISRGRVMSTIQILPGGRILVPDFSENCVVEYDATGKQVWVADIKRPNAACRLRNGRTLVSSELDAKIVDFDTDGKRVHEFRPGDKWRPFGIVQAK